MEHFAQLDENNVVLQVIIIDEDDIKDSDGYVNEDIGIFYCKQLINNPNSIWKRTSFNHEFRGRFGNVGFTYDESLDVFIAPKPYSSWSLNLETTDWISPLGDPSEISSDLMGEYHYVWNEELYQSDNTKGWVYMKINNE